LDRDLVLASTSPYRRALLERLGLPFRCVSPRVDEEALKAERAGETPEALAERLALAKAASVADAFPAATVIGSDQLVAIDGEVLGKPGTADRAVAQLLRLAGHSHRLITAVAILDRGRVVSHTDVTTLHMRPLTAAELARVVAADSPLDCAGGYKLEARGITLFERIDSADHTAIVGLPLIALTTILRDLGYELP
jgi:septum formation protein